MKTLRIVLLAVMATIVLFAFSSCGECKHQSTTWSIITESTCIAEGSRQSVCNDCGVVLKTEKIDKLAHTPGEVKVVKEATCTESGQKQQLCTACNSVINEYTIAAVGHKLGINWTVLKEATCVEKGEKIRKCTVCDEQVGEIKTIEKNNIAMALGSRLWPPPVQKTEAGRRSVLLVTIKTFRLFLQRAIETSLRSRKTALRLPVPLTEATIA